MRANVITIIDNANYGNRLQNFAMHRALGQIGFDEVLTVDVPLPMVGKSKLLWRLRRLANEAYTWAKNLKTRKKARLFKDFTRRYAPVRKVSADQLRLEEGAFVVGSDQIWNFNWGFGSRTDGFQCAAQIPRGRKLVYAASFGVSRSEVGEEWARSYAEWLGDFDPACISVREQEGALIARTLIDEEVAVVLDPTMLLTVEDWRSVEAKPSGLDATAPFCLKFFLGNDQDAGLIERIAASRGLKVVDVMGNGAVVGPQQFLWLVDHCDLVCTDSFHGTVFSLLFQKEFLLFERKQEGLCDMSSRIDTLDKRFGIADHIVAAGDALPERISPQRWEGIQSRIEEQRSESLGFLREALSSLDCLP